MVWIIIKYQIFWHVQLINMIGKKGILQGQKKNTNEIFSCLGCYQICNLQHTWQQKHSTISAKNISAQINNFMHSEDQKWGNVIMQMTTKIQAIKQFIKKLQNTIYDQIIQEKMIHTLNIELQSVSDKANIISAVKQIQQRKFNKLNCDQISKINSILQNKKIKRPSFRQASKKIQIKISQQIIQFIQKQFPDLKRIKSIAVQNLKNSQQDIRLQPIGQNNFKNKYNEHRNHNDDDENRRGHRNHNRVQNEKQRRRTHQIRKQNVNRPTRQQNNAKRRLLKCENTNQYPVVKVNQIENMKGNFNIALRILNIQKTFNVGKRQLIQFIAGDQTGKAVCVLNNSQLITDDSVISISKCRVYFFHGTRQIQSSDESQVFLQEFQIQNIGEEYNFSKRNNKQKNAHYQREKQETHTKYKKPRYHHQRNNQQKRLGQRNQYKNQRQIMHKSPQLVNINSARLANNNRGRQINNRNDQAQRKIGINNFGSDKFNRERPKIQGQRQDRLEKKHIQYSKIAQIGPGDQKLSFFAQVVQVITYQLQIQLKNQELICLLGDSTALIKGSFSNKGLELRQGKVYQFLNVDAVLVQEKIILRLNKEGQIRMTSMRIPNVNMNQNISNIEWEQQSNQEQVKSQEEDNNSTFLVRARQNSDEDFIDF